MDREGSNRDGSDAADNEQLAASGAGVKTPRRKWAKALEGWQAGLIIVGCAVLTAAVVVPRPVDGMEVPLPRVDWHQFSREETRDEQRVLTASAGLPYEARAVGEGLRQLGLAEVGKDAGALAIARRDLQLALLAWAEKHPPESLLALRALQAELFVRAVRRWEREGSPSAELTELGGDVPELFRKNGWMVGARFVGDDRVLRLFYRLRFGQALRLDKHPFAPTLNDLRLLYRFRMERLEREPSVDALLEEAKIATTLGEADSQYPSQITLGVVAYRLGKHEEAVGLFGAYRDAHPTGPWSLRVQNYLAAAQLAQE